MKTSFRWVNLEDQWTIAMFYDEDYSEFNLMNTDETCHEEDFRSVIWGDWITNPAP